jgi:hypothetical protein
MASGLRKTALFEIDTACVLLNSQLDVAVMTPPANGPIESDKYPPHDDRMALAISGGVTVTVRSTRMGLRRPRM